ncbi:similar to 3-hydroxyisobutyrate dehydrogenase [Plenodomus lingam JN3]|uniref:3-hydroxyisobutyrate dehydrogenase n=1 Tax=Leptosphaeria maculans (strain JN3 / isolate v23.1.3 / race Av1-4-5-6-7-8) TaxID=985895 RepID=E4ZW28_LEPMJ|nr:similar to 3-hydroxyisobutyrate dehydrogenase [Plenodomus lingam JN3]CBX95804.1 similar to 3-hydroxyisobutyrate dehydrogenase [Plenodomus lingam JN3]
MGYAMASNIRKKMPASSTLYINDINAAACTRFQNEYSTLGPIEILSTAREAADNAKVLISIVPAGVDVKKVYLDHETGVIAARKDKDRLILECSTIDVETTKEVGKTLGDGGWGIYIDTPVSGGVPAAQSGTLAMLIGYPSPPSEPSPSTPYPHLLTPTLHMLGPPSKFHYLSTLGAGLTAKIANNYLSGTILLATAEALALGTRHGLDPRALYAVIQSSTGQSWMCDHVCPIPNVQTQYWVPSNSGYRPGFRTEMMVKDLDLGVRSAAEVGVEPTMARAALAVWERAAVDERCRGRDGSSVYLHVGGVLPEGYEDLGRKEGGEWVFGE